MNNSSIRVFVAIELAPEVHNQVKVLWSHLQRDLHTPDIAWVKPPNWHLTLLFLGEVPVAQIDEVRSALHAACADIAPFELSIQGLGAFPNTRNPKVIWTGVDC
ncbi:MAG: 2,3-cyclic 3-phosphodiesterase [Abditibacteriota bacterium]|nr:2,3-cyclic 3-phosphodiesterase [Abditibacteriota bacterium]